MIGKTYKTLQRAYPTDNVFEKNTNYFDQDLKMTDISTRRECWNITFEITVNNLTC
jgi:hypothetical protein